MSHIERNKRKLKQWFPQVRVQYEMTKARTVLYQLPKS